VLSHTIRAVAKALPILFIVLGPPILRIEAHQPEREFAAFNAIKWKPGKAAICCAKDSCLVGSFVRIVRFFVLLSMLLLVSFAHGLDPFPWHSADAYR
jgi:hypothetical protein